MDRRSERRSVGGTTGGERDYPTAATNLIKLMDEYGVEKAIVMPPPQNKNQLGAYDYKSLQSALALFPNRLYLGAGGGTFNPMIQSVNASDVDEAVKYKFIKMRRP